MTSEANAIPDSHLRATPDLCVREAALGHVWMIARHKQDVSPEEMRKRSATLCARSSRGGRACSRG